MAGTCRDDIAYPEPSASSENAEKQGSASHSLPGVASEQSFMLKGTKLYAGRVWHVLDNCYALLKGSSRQDLNHKRRKQQQ